MINNKPFCTAIFFHFRHYERSCNSGVFIAFALPQFYFFFFCKIEQPSVIFNVALINCMLEALDCILPFKDSINHIRSEMIDNLKKKKKGGQTIRFCIIGILVTFGKEAQFVIFPKAFFSAIISKKGMMIE